jgi:hypothetical protein
MDVIFNSPLWCIICSLCGAYHISLHHQITVSLESFFPFSSISFQTKGVHPVKKHFISWEGKKCLSTRKTPVLGYFKDFKKFNFQNQTGHQNININGYILIVGHECIITMQNILKKT